MNVDLSQKEIELVLQRFKDGSYHDDRDEIDEELLVNKLRRHSEGSRVSMSKYQQDFKSDTTLPPLPQET